MKKINNPKKQALIALRKSQSLIKKVIEMIENDVYCISVLEQLLAVSGLLRSASGKILKNHLETCFKENIATHDAKLKDRLIGEVVRVLELSKKYS